MCIIIIMTLCSDILIAIIKKKKWFFSFTKSTVFIYLIKLQNKKKIKKVGKPYKCGQCLPF